MGIFLVVLVLIIIVIVVRYRQVKKNQLTDDELTAVVTATICYLNSKSQKSNMIVSNQTLSPWGIAAIYQEVTRRNSRGK